MKINTFKTYRFTGELWKYTTTRDAEGGEIRTYHRERSLNFDALTTGMGRFMIHFLPGDDDISLFDRMFLVTDANGVQLTPNGVYEIDALEPTVNMWGERVGIKARAFLFGRTD